MGSDKDFDRVLEIASQFGFVELDREQDEGRATLSLLECEQAVDEQSIRALTLKCLQIEILCGVEYDGWGCEAETGVGALRSVGHATRSVPLDLRDIAIPSGLRRRKQPHTGDTRLISKKCGLSPLVAAGA